MSSIAIITARGGSKRIPRKNIKEFMGKPIISYSIKAALESNLFDEVMVSTDDLEIAKVALYFGAKVPFYRSEKTSDDYATTGDVLAEVLEQYWKRGNVFDWMCCIYPTAPFITAEKLITCMRKLRDSDADRLLPVVRFSYPPQRAFIWNEKNRLEYKWPENMNMRSQDLEVFYHDAGQYYFYRLDKDNTIKKSTVIPYILSEMETQDIDSLEDWKLAELKYRIINYGNDMNGEIACQS